MRKLFEELTGELKSFLDQSDDSMLLLSCSENDPALVLKNVRDLEQESTADLFLLYADDFNNSESYVSAAVTHLAEEHERAQVAAKNLKQDPLPPFPAGLKDQKKEPISRLKEAIGFARSYLPEVEGHRLVWVMFPGTIADRSAYYELIRGCSAQPGLQPWMRNVRLIFRVPDNFVLKDSPLAKVPRIRIRPVDFGPAAMQRSLEDSAIDPQLPEAERMNSLLALATLDYAHGRVPEAIDGFRTVFEFGKKSGNAILQALALNGLGDIPHRDGNLDLAQHWYECAIDPALAAKEPLVLANVVQNLASIAFQKKQFIDAAKYYDTLSSLKHSLMDPAGKLQALEGRGLSQVELAQDDLALASFEEAALLGIGFELKDLAKQNFLHMRRVCERRQLHEKLKEVNSELYRMAA